MPQTGAFCLKLALLPIFKVPIEIDYFLHFTGHKSHKNKGMSLRLSEKLLTLSESVPKMLKGDSEGNGRGPHWSLCQSPPNLPMKMIIFGGFGPLLLPEK